MEGAEKRRRTVVTIVFLVQNNNSNNNDDNKKLTILSVLPTSEVYRAVTGQERSKFGTK